VKKDNQKNSDLKDSSDLNTNTVGEKNHSKARRRVIIGGGIIGASSVPEKWTSSLVESVVLPAHAATTGDDSGSGPGTGPTPTPTQPPATSAPATCAPATYAPATCPQPSTGAPVTCPPATHAPATCAPITPAP